MKPLESEVLQLLHAARQMKDMDKIEKADKLYSQALQFAPNHPEILGKLWFLIKYSEKIPMKQNINETKYQIYYQLVVHYEK